MKHLIIASTLTLTTALSPLASAQGGDNPVPGIDIIIKNASNQAAVMSVSFTPDQLKQINSVTGMERLSHMAMVGGQHEEKAAKGAQPKGGWEAVFKQGLIKNWNPEEKGGSTTISAQTSEQAYKVTFTVGAVKGDNNIDDAFVRRFPGVANSPKKQIQFDEADALFAKRGSIAAPAGCVTVSGAVDANCDGVADSGEVKAKGRRVVKTPAATTERRTPN